MTARGVHRIHVRRWLTGIETLTGAAAALGGALLMARPDGHLIGARTADLTGSPFGSWLVPGTLLLVLVGGGYLGAALCLATHARFAAAVSVVAGVGLVAFETCEVVWLGFQPLEAAYIAVGLVVAVLGLDLARR